MDIRELVPGEGDIQETLKAVVIGMLKQVWTIMPAQVTRDTADGHVATVQPTIKRAIRQDDGSLTYEDHPEHVDVPIHHLGGGGVSHTFPNKQGDTGAVLYASRSIDSWFQSDGTQVPMDDRMHSNHDGLYLSGIRSVPRALKQVAKDSAQHRSDDKHHVVDVHPTNGLRLKSVDPSTAPASDSFDPFAQATTFFEHLVHPTAGHAQNATDGGTTHSITNTHAAGPMLSAKNGDHTVNAHPDNGVSIASTVAHLISAPNASLDAGGNLKASGSMSTPGSVSGSSGAFSGGISLGEDGAGGSLTSTSLDGDVQGTFAASKVVSLAHVTGMQTLPQCADDTAAAAAGVALGGLYLSTAVTITSSAPSSGGSGGSSGTTTTSTTIPAGLLRVRLA